MLKGYSISITLFILISFVIILPAKSDDRKTIVTVYGEAITLEDINKIGYTVDNKNQIQTGKGSGLSVNYSTRMKLRKTIIGKMLDKNINKYGIMVSDEEIQRELDKLFQPGLIDENYLKKLQEKIKLLVSALERLSANHGFKNTIYDEELSSIITMNEWEQYIAVYSNNEKLDELKVVLTDSLNDMRRKSEISTRQRLLEEKLKERVTENIKVDEAAINKDFEIYSLKSIAILHFFDKNKESLSILRGLLLKGREIDLSKREWESTEIPNKIFYQREDIFYPSETILPFYIIPARYENGAFSQIIKGPLSMQWEQGNMREKYANDIKSQTEYYHFIKIISIETKGEQMSFEEFKAKKVKEIRDVEFIKWFKNEARKSVKVYDNEYSDIFNNLP